MVLRDGRNTRLLDDDIWQKAGLGFGRIRKIPCNRKTCVFEPFNMIQGSFQITKLDEETSEPEATQVLPIGPQRLRFVVEWPLSGMADWLKQPTSDAPWQIRWEGLFESQSSKELDCDQWLGQQLVIFDNSGITLNDIIKVMADTEGAHSPPKDRLMLTDGIEDKARFRVVKDYKIHILSHITVWGVRYSHAIVIQAAMYLYHKLAKSTCCGKWEGDVIILDLGGEHEDVFSPAEKWLWFDGGLMLTLQEKGQSITHRVRAPG